MLNTLMLTGNPDPHRNGHLISILRCTRRYLLLPKRRDHADHDVLAVRGNELAAITDDVRSLLTAKQPSMQVQRVLFAIENSFVEKIVKFMCKICRKILQCSNRFVQI